MKRGEEEIRTVFGDTKEEERGEEETGGEEEAKTRRRDEVRDKRVPARDDDGGEPRDVRSSPNEGEHEPQRLAFVESGDQASMPKEPEFDDDGDACGLEHVTNSIVEPQGPHKTPHDAPTPATNDVICSASVSHPPAETTVHTEPPPSGVTSDPDGTTHTSTTTTSGIRGPAHGPIFNHHALVDSPRDRAASGHFDPATSGFVPPTNSDAFDTAYDPTHITPVDITPIDPVAVDPVWRAHQTFDWGSFGQNGHEFSFFFCTIFTLGGQGFRDATGTVAFEGGGTCNRED